VRKKIEAARASEGLRRDKVVITIKIRFNSKLKK